MSEEVKKSGKFWIENDLVDNDLKDVSGNAFKVLVALTRHYNRTGTCFPSIRRLSKLTGLHHETVTKCLRELELLGYFEQIVIRERCKLRYKFSKTARKLLVEHNNLLVKPDSKETIKEVMKEAPTKKYVSKNPDPVKRDMENSAGYKIFPP